MKIIFNPDLSKQDQKVTISRQIKKLLHPTLLFNNVPLKQFISETL